MVIPLIRGNLSVECQLEAVGALLIDHESDDQSWVIYWISQYLTLKENGLLRDWASYARQAQPVA